MTQLRRPTRAELQVTVLECAILGAACVVTYWLVTTTEPHVYLRSRPAEQIGALWAVISTVFVLRDSYEKSIAAAVSRMAATSVSFVLCLIYLVFLPFHIWALGLLVGASALAVVLLGRGRRGQRRDLQRRRDDRRPAEPAACVARADPAVHRHGGRRGGGNRGRVAGAARHPAPAAAGPGPRLRCSRLVPAGSYFQAKTGCSKWATLIMFPCRATWQNW